MAENIITHSISAYFKNIKMIFFFSVPMLIAFMIPIFVRTPTFIAAGGLFLRTGSIPDMSQLEAGVMIISFLVSLFLIAFTITNINIVIKAQRTATSVGREVVKGITGYTLNVFWLMLIAELMLLVIQLITFEYKVQEIVAPILSFLVMLPFFYAPAGLVIDDLRPWRAVEKSLAMVVSKLPYFLLWLLIAFVSLSLTSFVFLALLPHGMAQMAALVLNSLIVMPFLIVMQTQIFISKYTIITD